MEKRCMNRKNIFQKDCGTDRVEFMVRYIYPLFFMNEFYYILFLRFNNFILNTIYEEKTSESYRHSIYNILILLFFLKPLFAYVVDNYYFSLGNVGSYILRSLYEWKQYLYNVLYGCLYTSYKAKYYCYKYLYKNNIAKKKENEERLLYIKSYFRKISQKKYVENILGVAVNRKSYLVLSECFNAFCLIIIYWFEGINFYVYQTLIFLMAFQMLLVSSVFDALIVERCKEKVHYEKIFNISYLMCIKIVCSLILYYSPFIISKSNYILFCKSFFVFLISLVLNDKAPLLKNNWHSLYGTNAVVRNEDGSLIKKTRNFKEQIKTLKRILIGEDVLRILFLLMLFNSSIDTKLTMLQHGIIKYNWPDVLLNYIPLLSQVSKLIGIAIFQLYTSRMSYKEYVPFVIITTMFLNLFLFSFFYYKKDANFVSPIFFLLNIIIHNILIKVLSLPIFLFCIEKAPLNMEATMLNIYIFFFNLSNFFSKRKFLWSLFLEMYHNLYAILLLSLFTTCATLFYCFNISLKSVDMYHLDDITAKTQKMEDIHYKKRREKEREKKDRDREREREREREMKKKKEQAILEKEKASFHLGLLRKGENTNNGELIKKTGFNNTSISKRFSFLGTFSFFKKKKQNIYNDKEIEKQIRYKHKLNNMDSFSCLSESPYNNQWLIVDDLK